SLSPLMTEADRPGKVIFVLGRAASHSYKSRMRPSGSGRPPQSASFNRGIVSVEHLSIERVDDASRVKVSRRGFLNAMALLGGSTPFLARAVAAQAGAGKGPLLAYVGTFSSPLRDMLPTQVDLPPGNGRGIHIFQVDRSSGALTPRGVYELGTSPNCLVINAA